MRLLREVRFWNVVALMFFFFFFGLFWPQIHHPVTILGLLFRSEVAMGMLVYQKLDLKTMAMMLCLFNITKIWLWMAVVDFLGQRLVWFRRQAMKRAQQSAAQEVKINQALSPLVNHPNRSIRKFFQIIHLKQLATGAIIFAFAAVPFFSPGDIVGYLVAKIRRTPRLVAFALLALGSVTQVVLLTLGFHLLFP